MTAALVVSICAGAAATALFATLPWVGTRSRSWRLAPHLGTTSGSTGTGPAAAWAGAEVLLAVGTASARLVDRVTGAVEPLTTRLDRVHHGDDPTTFRFQQGMVAVTGAVLGVVVCVAVAAPAAVTVLVVVGLPGAAVLAPEFALTRRCRRWSTALRFQLPVVGEQLVALLEAGRSPTAALEQIADHTGTPIQRDLARVVDHLKRGGGLDDALARWAEVADADGVRRLAGVLTLHHRTPALADLVSREVDTIRDELHRELLAQIDRRGQQVWIPVTVAALIPGAIFLLVPFFDALRLFGATP